MKALAISPWLLSLALVTSAVADPFKPGFKQQLDLGQQAAAQIRKKEKVLPETDLRAKLIKSMGEKFVKFIPEAEMKKKPYKFTFEVIDSKEVNAFALPGGPLFFYTGLLERMKSEDELAAVMGHEMTHVREEHWAGDYAAAQRRQVGLIVGDLLGVPRTVLNVAAVADGLLLGPKYSRKSEDRADLGGFRLMVEAGYNPQGAVDLFDTLASIQKGNRPPEILNSHPDDKKRREGMLKRMQEAQKKGAVWPAKKPLPLPQPERKPAEKG